MSSLQVQRSLELRIEAQSKYLETILERACNALVDTNLRANEIESNPQKSPEFGNREIHGCLAFSSEPLQLPLLSEIAGADEKPGSRAERMNGCSVESSCSSNGSFGSKGVLKKRPRSVLFNARLNFGNGLLEDQTWMSSA
ncbi:protein PHR1-LIKE 3-like [Phalaenopsis equestris]|uniref:protein PHR1-LIKE 3-like n=1 Tax=Phalaenopsis equestris TaxID=78828 RepID=UPI0009E32F7D|nr:protein PHR1-LIKE 3-like [Phalaenopsis equestris]XP_020598066.1 protein PHR1-LIKE 3-like [Phalaenopsis equestris]